MDIFQEPVEEGLEATVRDNAAKFAALVYILCFMFASFEPRPPTVAAAVIPLEKRADYWRVLYVSSFLSAASGIVNAMAIMEMNGTASHHTGNMTHAGRLAGMDGLRFLSLIVAYIAGAALAGYYKCDGEAIYTRRLSGGMLSSAIAVAGACIIHSCGGRGFVTLPLMSFSQGIQNAVTRKCISLPICTAHHTGYLTDAGSQVGAWARAGAREPLPTKAKFFMSSIVAFIVGGYIAKKLLDAYGLVSGLAVAAAMAACGLGLLPLPASAPKEA